MSENGNLGAAVKAAGVADDAFEAAVHAAGYKSRWHWNHHLDVGTEDLRAAYRAKITADNAMHAAFVRSREVA